MKIRAYGRAILWLQSSERRAENGGRSCSSLPSEKKGVKQMGLKWHNFLRYFSLWAGTVASGILGIGMFAVMSEVRSGAFWVFLLGAAMLAQAGISAYAAVKLIKWEWSGVGALKLLYWLSLAADVLMLFTGDQTFGSFLASAAVTVGMIYVNGIYYDKRRELFH